MRPWYLFRIAKKSSLSPSVCKGFTLLELMVAMSILGILILMLAEMFNMMSQSWLQGQRRINNFSKARLVLDLMARDLVNGVFESRFPNFDQNKVIFFTKRPGISAQDEKVRDFSLVTYEVDQNSKDYILKRGAVAIPWSNDFNLAVFEHGISKNEERLLKQEVASGVIAFGVRFFLKDGKLTDDYTESTLENPVRSIGVTLAVLDDRILESTPSERLGSLVEKWNQVKVVNQNLKSIWEQFLVEQKSISNSEASGLSGFKIYERYVDLEF